MSEELPEIIEDPNDVFYTGPERRQSHIAWRDRVDAEIKSLRLDVDANTLLTKSVKTDTSELVETFKSIQGAMRVLDMLGKLAKPLAYIFMLCSALWGVFAAVKGGHPK